MGKRIKKLNPPKFFNLSALIGTLVVIFFGWCVFRYAHLFITDSPYFKIDEIEIAIIGRASLADTTIIELLGIHKGKSIFAVDLKNTRDYILSNYPEVRGVVINRAFPNKLVLRIKPRRPVAQVNLSLGFCLIDSEGVVLSDIRGLAHEDLPIVSGIDPRSILVSIGKKCEYSGLKRALRLLSVLGSMEFRQGHEVHMIDVSDARNLSLYIEDGIEIKIGRGDFRKRITMLNEAFSNGSFEKGRIKYIDLRFGDVIVKPR